MYCITTKMSNNKSTTIHEKFPYIAYIYEQKCFDKEHKISRQMPSFDYIETEIWQKA